MRDENTHKTKDRDGGLCLLDTKLVNVYSNIIANFDVKHNLGEVYDIAIDAEWRNIQAFILDTKVSRPEYLSKQYTIRTSEGVFTLVLWNKDYPKPSRDVVNSLEDYVGNLVVIYDDIQDKTVFQYLDVLNLTFSKTVKVYMFYAYQDVSACLLGRGQENINHLSQGLITKRRNLTGSLSIVEIPKTSFKLYDLIGAFNCGLDKAFDMVGMVNEYKHLTEDWDKSRMEEFISADPDNFLRYSVGDTVMLFDLWEKRVEQLNELVQTSLDFHPDFTVDNCPRSSGSLVSITFQKWLRHTHPSLMTAVNVLAEVPKKSYGLYKAFKDALSNWDMKGELEANYRGEAIKLDYDRPGNNFKPRSASNEVISGMSGASIRAFAELNKTTACFNALVQGGRCANENPKEYRFYDVFDIDLNSCYGSALNKFDYPIGLPTIYAKTQDSQSLTLGQFLEKYGVQLVDGLYQIIVSGELSFLQDLVYSKIGVTQQSIRRNIDSAYEVGSINVDSNGIFDDTGMYSWTREVEAAHIDADFVLLRKELQNGVITSQVLDLVRKVSTEQELKSWLNLEVVTAAWYPKHLEVSPDELVKELSCKPGSMFVVQGDRVDKRTRKWCRISLSGFIGSFIKTRKALKKQVKVKGDEFDVKQNALKLFINTTYGCLAAPYFAMGNTILANNITAKARCGVWMLSKALGTAQSITDGGLYSNKGVRLLKDGKKPGFETLSDYEALNRHRSVKSSILTNFNRFYTEFKRYESEIKRVSKLIESGETEELKAELDNLEGEYKSIQGELDQLSTDHINTFWSRYGLELPFDIEHKYTNTCKSAVTFGSGDYLFIEPVKGSDEINGISFLIASRGARDKDHPKKLFLLYLGGLIDLATYKANAVNYEYSHLIGVSEYVEGYKQGNELYTKGHCFPGDELYRVTHHRPNTKHAYAYTENGYQNRDKRHQKQVREHQKSIDKGDIEMFGMAKDLGDKFPNRYRDLMNRACKPNT